jgi:hypothetical protein
MHILLCKLSPWLRYFGLGVKVCNKIYVERL